MTIIKAKTVERFNDVCIRALQKVDSFGHSRPASLYFVEAATKDETIARPHAGLVFNYDKQKLETVIEGSFSNKRIHTFSLDADNWVIARSSKKEISELFDNGYTIGGGKIILCRRLSEQSKRAGTGYDYIPDEDEYNDALLKFGFCKLELEIESEMPKDAKEKVQNWFSGLKKYSD